MFSLVEIVGIILPFVVAFYYITKKHYDYFKDKNVHYIQPIWLLGNLYEIFLLLVPPQKTLTDMYNKIKGHRFGGIFQFWKPYYFVCDPGLIEKILIKDFSHFEDHGLSVDLEVNPLDENLFILTGHKWRAMRNKMSPAFTSGKLKWMFPQIEKCAASMVEYLKQNISAGDLEMVDLSARYGLDVIASCAFGLESDAVNQPVTEFRKLTNRLVRPPLWRKFIFFVRFGLPDLFKKLKLKVVEPHVEKFFFELTRDSLNERAKSNFKRNDFIQLLLELKQKGSVSVDVKDEGEVEQYTVEEKVEFTDSLLASQVFIFFMAGFEASASLTGYALYYISKNPEIQKRLRDDLIAAEMKHGGFCYEALRDCTLLDNCISEVLRMQTPGTFIFRQCTKPYYLDDQVMLEKGDNVFIPVVALHHDAEYYPDPFQFNPDRFENWKPHPGIFLPFGEGPRICIARRFVILQMKVGIAMMIRHFEVLHSKKTIEPFVKKSGSMFNEPVGGIWVRLEMLKDNHNHH